MSDQYRLVDLGSAELLAGLSELVRQGNVLSARVLAHLVELEERMLHLELGLSSLFSYCVEALGMSEGSAGRRVTAARVCRRFPEAFERVACGELHLCALCALAPHLKPENSAELFEACRGKTRRQVEVLVAVRFPRPDVREQIRRLPVHAQAPVEATKPVEAEKQTSLPTRAADEPASPALAPEGTRIPRNPVLLVAGGSGSDVRRRARELEPLSAARFGVHFTADTELRELIERARALASHRLPNGDLAALMKLMAACFVREEEKRRFGIGVKARRVKAAKETTPAPSTEGEAPPGGVEVSPEASEPGKLGLYNGKGRKRGRYLPVAVRREAHARDRGQCSFVSVEGRRCTARALLELDHREPFARLGKADAANIRLLCKAHNLLHARHCFGAMHLASKIAAKKRGE